jgi:hypothetical protein
VIPERDEPDAPPPVLGSWRNVYALVALELAILIALFYALTRWAS